MSNQKKRTIVMTAVLMFLCVGVILYCDWRGNLPETLYVCRKALLSAVAFALLSGIVHDKAAGGLDVRGYIAQMFCGKESWKGRKAYLDHARILAAVMVILTHACSMQVGETAAAWKIGLLRACTGIGLVCNPLYVMISGALLLSAGKKEESFGAFYWKRFFKVVLPMVVYYIIFLCVAGQVSLIPPRNLAKGALQILAGASGVAPHYWLLYTLISLYVTAPFVRVMVNHLQDSHIAFLFVLILTEESLAACLPLMGVKTGFAMDLAGWEGVFIMGYILAERRHKWMERFVLTAGGICAVIIACAVAWDYSLREDLSNTAPVMVLFAGAVLMVLSKLEKRWKNPSPFPVRTLAKYSYSIILVHWYGLFVVVWGKIGIQPLRFGCIGGIVLTVFVSVIVCFIIGFTADNTVVFAVQYICGRIRARFQASS